MKRSVGFLFSIILLFCLASSQTIIENTSKPKGKNPGRILSISEQIQIEDEPSKFYFVRPEKVMLSENGHIFVADPDGGNLLNFSSDGGLVTNLIKRGEGPGEIQDYFLCEISSERSYIFDFWKRKIVTTDHQGAVLNEFKLTTGQLDDFIGIFQNWLIFDKRIPPIRSQRKKSQFYDDKMTILLISKDGNTVQQIYNFPTKRYYLANGKGLLTWAMFRAVLDANKGYLYISNTRPYLLHLFDIRKKKVVKSFRRAYKRIGYLMDSREEGFIKQHDAPRKKFTDDIKKIFVRKGLLWILTSTYHSEKGYLIDVFNEEGQYLDNFYLKINGELMSVYGDFLFVLESDNRENYVIKRYKIIE